MQKKVKTIKREEIFKGKILDVVVDTIELPNGKHADREMVLHRGAAAVVPFDDEGNIYLVEQYRHAVGDYILEIPAGLINTGEDTKDCAYRELEEEIGYKAKTMNYLMTIYPAVGLSTEKIDIYIAKGLIKTQQNLDEDEFVEVKKFSLGEALELIENNTIIDTKTICGILMAAKNFSN